MVQKQKKENHTEHVDLLAKYCRRPAKAYQNMIGERVAIRFHEIDCTMREHTSPNSAFARIELCDDQSSPEGVKLCPHALA